MLHLGGWEHDLWSIQLLDSAEPGVWLPAHWLGHCWSEGGGGALRQEVSSYGGPGAIDTHRANQNPSAEKEEHSLKWEHPPLYL